jgi:hypothetical protein
VTRGKNFLENRGFWSALAALLCEFARSVERTAYSV